MDSDTNQTATPVPDELMNDLHGANEQFHKARLELENQMNDTDFSHQRRVDAAADGVRAAEHEVEAITEQIAKVLHGGDSPPRTTTGKPDPD